MKHIASPDPISDPFREHSACPQRRCLSILGGVFEFESNSRKLLNLVDAAFDRLPAHVFATTPPLFRIRLLLTSDVGTCAGSEPPRMKMHAGPGMLCGTIDAANFAIVSSELRTGLVVVSRDMLRYRYHTRYELIEFAVYALASRAQHLVSLHAACIGENGRGLLLMGASGGGKSTLALHCLLRNMELVAEDGVLVAPDTLRATGIGSFVHLREDSLRFIARPADEARIRKSPVIRRRSGVEKFEVDLRRNPYRRSLYRLAPTPPTIARVVFLSKLQSEQGDGATRLLRPLRKADLLQRLTDTQPYAALQPEWSEFIKHVARIGAVELRRGKHPDEAVDALRELLQ